MNCSSFARSVRIHLLFGQEPFKFRPFGPNTPFIRTRTVQVSLVRSEYTFYSDKNHSSFARSVRIHLLFGQEPFKFRSFGPNTPLIRTRTVQVSPVPSEYTSYSDKNHSSFARSVRMHLLFGQEPFKFRSFCPNTPLIRTRTIQVSPVPSEYTFYSDKNRSSFARSVRMHLLFGQEPFKFRSFRPNTPLIRTRTVQVSPVRSECTSYSDKNRSSFARSVRIHLLFGQEPFKFRPFSPNTHPIETTKKVSRME